MVVKEANDIAKQLVAGIFEVIKNWFWLLFVVLVIVLIVFFAGEALELIRNALQVIIDVAGTVI